MDGPSWKNASGHHLEKFTIAPLEKILTPMVGLKTKTRNALTLC